MRFGLTRRERWLMTMIVTKQGVKYYAWFPVKLVSGEWAWLEYVWGSPRRDIFGFIGWEYHGL